MYIFGKLKRGDSSVCQERSVVPVYVENSSQGQVETSLHFFNVGFTVDIPQVLKEVG